jgi:hypothetical protein
MLLWAVIVLIGAAALGGIVFLFVRWLMGRQRRVRLPDEMLDEMSRYAEQFQSIVGDMNRLFTNIEDHSRRKWRRRYLEIIANLREMNRLLRQLHNFLESEAAAAEAREFRPAARVGDEVADTTPPDAGARGPLSEFSSPAERRKFHRMSAITGEEIADVNLDDLLGRFNSEAGPGK